tara:strand:- start:1184 stop:1756 length:573 start_codon:yes stop_codon:yes gene_type:complete
MWHLVDEFEQTIADYAGSEYAVAIDSCTHALYMCGLWENLQTVTLPKQTYVSVPMQFRHLGCKINYQDLPWTGAYGIGYNIVDSACRFTAGMYMEETLMCLSFHHRKILSTVKGGMILTDDKDFVDWCRPMIYDGRDKRKMSKDDRPIHIGYHFYMTPETAELGLKNFKNVKLDNPDHADYRDYYDISYL